MSFQIREWNRQNDWTIFARLSWSTAKATHSAYYQELVRENPGKTDEELFHAYKEELKEFDFDDERCMIFVVEVEGRFAGYVWVSIRNSRDSWDLNRPMWIYDITLDSDYRGRGLGKVLMRKAEEWAKAEKRNLGLFVHAHNEPAIRLYESEGYVVKSAPMTLRFSEKDGPRQLSTGLDFVECDYRKSKRAGQMARERFARLVRFSHDASEKEVATTYQNFVESYEGENLEQSRFLARREEGLCGLLWVGQAPFRREIGMIYEVIIPDSDKSEQQAFLTEAIRWSQKKELSALYTLLHAADDLDASVLESAGFVVPGYFMEKRLT